MENWFSLGKRKTLHTTYVKVLAPDGTIQLKPRELLTPEDRIVTHER